MLKGLEYETVLVKMVMAFMAAIAVVMGLVLLMGIQLATCSPVVVAFGIVTVGVILIVSAYV